MTNLETHESRDKHDEPIEVFEVADKIEFTPETVQALSVDYSIEDEKKLLRKYDLHILTYVSALYLLSYLDRSNIGNANTAGMGADLNLTDSQYQWFLTIFYISYICFQFMTFLWKIFPPRYYAPSVVIFWGICSSCGGAVQNWSGMMALRFLLGIAEAGFGPGVPYYITLFYYRHEITFRTGIFISLAPLASAFAGALAYGITSNHHLAIASWRVLFIVEGLPSIAVGLIGYFFLPNDAQDCYFLNEKEKYIAQARTAKKTGTTERDHTLNFSEIVQSFTDIKNILPMLMYFSINVTFASLPVFLPEILKGMGYTSIHAQGLSAPPYVVTFLLVLVSSYISDRVMQRGVIIATMSAIGAVGFLILAVSEKTAVKYFAVFLAAGGEFSCVAILIAWVGNNQSSDTRRSAGFVLVQLIGQCGPILGTRLYPTSEAPHYRKGFWVCFGFSCFIVFLSLVLRTYLKYENNRLDAKYGKINRKEALQVSDEAAVGAHGFRYVL